VPMNNLYRIRDVIRRLPPGIVTIDYDGTTWQVKVTWTTNDEEHTAYGLSRDFNTAIAEALHDIA
jgi:hypothetical protein